MKKSLLFLIIGIFSILISIAFFVSLKEEVMLNQGDCGRDCGKYENYFDAFTPKIFCFLICRVVEDQEIHVYHNPIYVLFFWIGIISIIISGILYLIGKRHYINGK